MEVILVDLFRFINGVSWRMYLYPVQSNIVGRLILEKKNIHFSRTSGGLRLKASSSKTGEHTWVVMKCAGEPIYE